eukprot:scaffold21603_cov19-Tisochrysis_lutea.AAC.1
MCCRSHLCPPTSLSSCAQCCQKLASPPTHAGKCAVQCSAVNNFVYYYGTPVQCRGYVFVSGRAGVQGKCAMQGVQGGKCCGADCPALQSIFRLTNVYPI